MAQIITPEQFDVKNIIFQEPANEAVPNSPHVAKRVHIKYRYPNGKIGDFVVMTEPLFSYGIQEERKRLESDAPGKPSTGPIQGYSLPLVLFSKDGTTPSEQALFDLMANTGEVGKDFLVDNRKKLQKFTLERSELKKIMNCIYRKVDKETGDLVDQSPVMNVKLLTRKTDDEVTIVSRFRDGNTNESLDPMTLVKTMGHVTAAYKIDSIYVASHYTFQVKLLEAFFVPLNKNTEQLLPFKPMNVGGSTSGSTSVLPPLEPVPKQASIVDSDEESDSEDEDPTYLPPKPVAVPVVATKTKKVVKK